MPEIAWILLAAVLAVLIAMAGTVMGWLLGRRSVVVPAVRGYDPNGVGEETVEVRTSDPESAAVAAELDGLPEDFGTGMWPVTETSRLDPLESETVRITLAGVRVPGKPASDDEEPKPPWAYLTRNRRPEDWLKLTRTQEQRKLDGVSG